MEFAASHLPDKMGPEGRQRWDAFDNIHIGVQERYKHITRCYYKFANVSEFIYSEYTSYKLGKGNQV